MQQHAELLMNAGGYRDANQLHPATSTAQHLQAGSRFATTTQLSTPSSAASTAVCASVTQASVPVGSSMSGPVPAAPPTDAHQMVSSGKPRLSSDSTKRLLVLEQALGRQLIINSEMRSEMERMNKRLDMLLSLSQVTYVWVCSRMYAKSYIGLSISSCIEHAK